MTVINISHISRPLLRSMPSVKKKPMKTDVKVRLIKTIKLIVAFIFVITGPLGNDVN
jgi:hypothetical protein